jgi:hypothetical protein
MSTWESEMTPEDWASVGLPEMLCLFCGEVMEQWDEEDAKTYYLEDDAWVCPKGCGIPYG